MKTTAAIALAVVLLLVGIAAGAFIPQIHQTYTTETSIITWTSTAVWKSTKTHYETVTAYTTVEPPNPVEEMSSRLYREYGDTWRCIGEIQNTGMRELRWVDVRCYIFGAGGGFKNLLYVEWDTVFNLAPGQKAPLKIMFYNCSRITEDCTYKLSFQISDTEPPPH